MAEPSAPPYASDADDSDVDLDFGQMESAPLPDLSTLGAPPGYETLGYTDSSVPPPYIEGHQAVDRQHQFAEIIYLSEDEAREALLMYVAEECCYGKSAAREMNINNILPSSAFHYELVTFIEGRGTKRTFVPYVGDVVDGPSNGIPPAPWDIPCTPEIFFSPEVREFEIPHTAEVLPCHHCHATGQITCSKCHGSGKVRCSRCHGSGRVSHYNSSTKRRTSRTCYSCSGSGKKRCSRCTGTGKVTCPSCSGRTQLKWFVQLTVTFNNLRDDHVVEHTDLPNAYIKDAEGTIIFNETQDRVQPIIAHPEVEVNQNSHRIVSEHQDKCQTSMLRMLRQKHQIRSVPVSEVHWTWKDKASRFWVYGQERKIHIPRYPQDCCWGCVIL